MIVIIIGNSFNSLRRKKNLAEATTVGRIQGFGLDYHATVRCSEL
jgi:hypothetical protein